MEIKKEDRPTVTKLYPPLELTPEQVEFIRPLLVNESGGPDSLPGVIIAQVRSDTYPNVGKVHIAFALVDYKTGREILGLIERSKTTRYPPAGSLANFVEILPQGEPVFVVKDRRKKNQVVSEVEVPPPNFGT